MSIHPAPTYGAALASASNLYSSFGPDSSYPAAKLRDGSWSTRAGNTAADLVELLDATITQLPEVAR